MEPNILDPGFWIGNFFWYILGAIIIGLVLLVDKIRGYKEPDHGPRRPLDGSWDDDDNY